MGMALSLIHISVKEKVSTSYGYNIGSITILLTNSGSKEEVLAAINSIFTNFAGFVTAIGLSLIHI